jgi:hypothetical protein
MKEVKVLFNKTIFALSLLISTNQMASALNLSENSTDLKNEIKDELHSANILNKRLKGVIYSITKSTNFTIGSPNIFGATVEIAIPPPSGTIDIGGYNPPQHGLMYFFAKEIDKSVKELVAKEPEIPSLLPGVSPLNSNFIHIKHDISQLEEHDQKIQQLVNALNYNTKRNSLLIGSEVLAMSNEVIDLTDILKSTHKEIDFNFDKHSSTHLAHQDPSWK